MHCVVGYSLEKDRHWLDKAGVDVESLRHRNFFQRIISRIKIGGTGSGRRHSEGFAGLGGVQDTVIEPHPRFEVRSNSCNL